MAAVDADHRMALAIRLYWADALAGLVPCVSWQDAPEGIRGVFLQAADHEASIAGEMQSMAPAV